MKFFTSCYIFWFSTAFAMTMSNNKMQENLKNLVQNNNTILKDEIWHSYVIFNGSITNVHFLQKKSSIIRNITKIDLNENKTTEINNDDEGQLLYKIKLLQSLFKITKVMYTALECKYSDLIVKFLTYCFYTDKNHDFHDLKPHIRKMMFNLFAFRYYYSNLMSINQTLIFSLISLNTYFSNPINDKNKTIIPRMINLIERFRCKNCLISNNDYYGDYHDTNSKINEFSKHLQRYSDYIDIEILNGSEMSTYNEEMYNPIHLLLGRVFEMYPFIDRIIVKWEKNELSMIEVYKKIIKTNDIKDIFNYQMFFIQFINDIFVMTFIEINNRTFNTAHKLRKVLNYFDLYIKRLIPNNYPPNLYNPIKSLRNALQDDLEKMQSKFLTNLFNMPLSDDTKIYLQVHTIVNNVSLIVLRNLKITVLIESIVNHEYFKSFSESIRLFLSNSDNIENYHLVKNNPIEELFPNRVCQHFLQLRENLFLFRSLIAGKQQAYHLIEKTNGPDYSILSSVNFIKKYLAYTYSKFKGNTEIIKILAPITIHIKDFNYSTLECTLTSQYILLTINLMEDYEIHHCRSTNFKLKLNLDMYLEIIKDEHLHNAVVPENVYSPADFNIKYLEDRIINGTKQFVHDFDDEVDAVLAWVDVLIPNSYFYYYDSEFNSNILMWNGIENHVDEVALSILQDVYDYDYLVKFQIVKLKWLINNVLKKMLYIVQHIDRFKSTNSEDGIITFFKINKKLKNFKNLAFPSFICQYVNTAFAVYTKMCLAIEEETMTAKALSEYKSIIREQIEILKISETDDSSKIIDFIHDRDVVYYSILTDINFATKILEFINKSKIILPVNSFYLY